MADDWITPGVQATAPADDWVTPGATPPATTPAAATDDWVTPGASAPEPKQPGILERVGIAQPGSPVAEHGILHEIGDIPRKIGAWWREGQETAKQAEADDKAAWEAYQQHGDLSRLIRERTEAQRTRDMNMAGGLAAGGVPSKVTLPGAAVRAGTSEVTGAAAANAARSIGQTVAKPVADTIEKVLSPTTRGPFAQEAEGLIREKVGERARQTEIARSQMDEFQQVVNSKTPAEQNAFVSYVEGRSQGARLADPELQPVADTLRRIYEERRNTIASMPSTARTTFIEDYYPHMWENYHAPTNAPGVVGTMQGSGRNLRERTVPTLQDGINAGLTPLYQNPLEATLAYVTNMDRFIAHNQIFDTAKANNTIRFFGPGEQPEGWWPLKGRLAENNAGNMRAYAPEDFARVYNNFISRGWHDVGPTVGKIYDTLQKASNAITMSELGLSGFHATTMVQEGMVSEFARAIGRAARGDTSAFKTAMEALKPFDTQQAKLLGQGAADLAQGNVGAGAAKVGKSLIPAGTRKLIDRGLDFEHVYLNRKNMGPEFAKVVDLGAKANMRAVGSRAADYRGSAMGSFWDAWKHGTLEREMSDAAADIKARPVLGSLSQGARFYARTMDTIAQPLFDKMIPRLKNGAFYEEMADWLKAHPQAADAEQAAAARQIWDSIDNRFGEMQLDNLFWNKMLKQTAQLMVRAVGWDVGTVREIGGGVVDMTRGRSMDLSPRAKYVIALPIVAALVAQTMSYLKTGKPSDDPFLYPTGGTLPDGAPEKAIVPGYMKDVLSFAHDPQATAGHKIATGPRTAWELWTNRDYRDLPIAETSEWARQNGAPPPLVAYLEHVVKAPIPISIKQYLERKEGTNISPAERALGMSPAPRYLQEPDEVERIMERLRTLRDKRKERADRRLEGQREQ